jgi:hypothetical protein
MPSLELMISCMHTTIGVASLHEEMYFGLLSIGALAVMACFGLDSRLCAEGKRRWGCCCSCHRVLQRDCTRVAVGRCS